jgi:hypothetical protein
MKANSASIANTVICCRRGILRELFVDGGNLVGRIRIEDLAGGAVQSAPYVRRDWGMRGCG